MYLRALPDLTYDLFDQGNYLCKELFLHLLIESSKNVLREYTRKIKIIAVINIST